MSLKQNLFLMTSAVSLALASAPAFAQDVDDEIIATGLRQAYQGDFTELETPQVNQDISSVILAIAGSETLDEALDLSASISRQNNFGGLWNSFSVRGFSGDINLPSGFLVNGFNAGRGFGGPRDLAGIESVDILKGPRSALFGRGEPGGTINLITKRPTFDTGGYVEGTVGSWNQFRGEGDVQTVLGENESVGVRLVGFFEDAESFREGLETSKYGFYPSLTFAPNDNTTITYELEFTEQDIPQDRGVVYSPDFGFSPSEVFTGENVPIETHVLGHQLEGEYEINENWSFLGGAGYRETTLEGGAFEPQFGSRQTFFRDGQTISRFFRFRDFDSEYFVLRGELEGDFETGGLRHRVIIGADYDEFDNSLFIERDRPNSRGDVVDGVRQDLTFDGRPISEATPEEFADFLLLDVLNPVLGNFNVNGLGPNTDRNELLKGFGLYVQDQISIGDNLQIRIGGRFDDFEQDFTNLREDPVETLTRSFTRFSPQVGAVYTVNDGFSVYASYGEGFRQQTGIDFQRNLFDPNVTDSIEGGFKFDLGAFSDTVDGIISLTVFEVQQSNFLVNDTRPEAQDAGFFSIPAGEARSTGLEFDANVNFDNDISLWASYAFTAAEFENSFADADGFGFTIEPGDPLINTPEHQFNIQVAKGFEFESIDAQLGAGVLYVDDRNGFVGSDFELPSYTTFRAFAEIEPVDNISVRLDVDNIFDETFFTNSFADVWVQPGAPRRFRVSARYDF